VRGRADTRRLKRAIRESAATIAGLAGQAEAIAAACAMAVRALKSGGKILTAGNGGSAAEALHMAEELTGRYRANRRALPAISLVADPTALTCIGNDFGFERVFSRQVEALGRRGDVLVLFSTSGMPANLIAALAAARKRGVKTICLLGKGGGAMAGKGDGEIIVTGATTERIQEAHQVIVHAILDAIEAAFGTEKAT
jgi:D-sedoheptulose 7-phosphate isomerase